MAARWRIAVIPGDGIGKEVMPEGVRVLQAAARRFDITLELTAHEWASCDYYARTGTMMPDDWKERLAGTDAIYFGAVGWPAAVPDHVSLWGSILKFRRELDQYVNLRPVRAFAGVPCPLAGRGPGDIDFLIVRENTEGEYSSVGVFEPVHGSAPDIFGRNIANPIAMIWSGAMMLDFLGGGSGPARQAHDAIVAAIEGVLASGPHTPDLGGSASTTDVGRVIAARVEEGR